MKRLLFIAQQAYPVRSSESICNSKVAYSLAEAGYHVDVISYKYKSTYPEDTIIDSILRNSPNLSIHEILSENHQYYLSRSKSLRANIISLWKMFIMWYKTGYFYNGMADAFDILVAVKTLIGKLDSFPYDAVLTRAYSSELAAIYLKEHFGVKWIANWNDPYPICRFPKPYGKGPSARIQFGYKKVYRKVKTLVDYHTFPSLRLRDYMLICFHDVELKRTAVIPHMAHSKLLPKPASKHRGLKLVSCGSVQNPRNPSLFIRALKEIVEEMQLSQDDLHCYFVGKFDPFLNNLINENHLEGIVTLTGPKKYAECLDFIASCDLSLIIEANCDEGIYLPTKFADAIQCRIPVFCVSPQPGTLKDLVEKYHNGYFSDNTSLSSIKGALKQALFDFNKGDFPVVSSTNMHCFFEKDIVSQYDSLLNEVCL